MERRWHRVIRSDRVGESSVPVFVGARRIVVVRGRSGLRAFPDRCPHAGAPLRGIRCADDAVVCPRHGWSFRLADGACPGHPLYALRLWEVREREGWVEVREPESAEIW